MPKPPVMLGLRFLLEIRAQYFFGVQPMARAARMARPKRMPQKQLAPRREAIFSVSAWGALGSARPKVLKSSAWRMKAPMPTGSAAL